jgi:hypothetical protein
MDKFLKYRKRPLVIEALQYDGTRASATVIRGKLLGTKTPAHYFDDVLEGADGMALRIETLEGNLRVMPTDWVIVGVEGEAYPCKDSVFQATYEAVS